MGVRIGMVVKSCRSYTVWPWLDMRTVCSAIFPSLSCYELIFYVGLQCSRSTFVHGFVDLGSVLQIANTNTIIEDLAYYSTNEMVDIECRYNQGICMIARCAKAPNAKARSSCHTSPGAQRVSRARIPLVLGGNWSVALANRRQRRLDILLTAWEEPSLMICGEGGIPWCSLSKD